MAAEATLGAVATLAGQFAVNQIIKEGSRLSRVRKDLEWIEIHMRLSQSYLKDAEAIQVKSAVVSNFIREIWNLASDVRHIMDKYFPKLLSNTWNRWKGVRGIRRMIIGRDFSKEVEDIKARVKDLTEARKLFEADARSSSLEVVKTYPRQTFPHVDEPNVVGINSTIEDLKQKVLDKDLHHHVVSITGTAGLGKTTLARKVYNSVRQRFDCAAWICVSESPNIQNLLRDIAGQVGLQKEKMEQNLETNLSELLSTKRYVIVVDDIWHTKTWDALKIHLPTNSKNKRGIILTSQNEDVGLYVGGPKSLFKLQPLDLENSRHLFYQMIADDPRKISETQYSLQLKNIGEQILERCGGLPLAIILAAGLLRGRSSDSAWKGVLEGIMGMSQNNDKWLDIFALSYKDLPDHLKQCFLYFGLFPEDCEIEAFELINLWAAEGFISGSEVREVEEVGYDSLNQLIERNLIQVNGMSGFSGRVRSVQIHDILYRLCIREANETNFFNIHTDAVNCHSTYKVCRVGIHGSHIDHYVSLNPQTSRVRAMLCFHRETRWEGRVTKNFLQDSKSLQLLRIENAYISPSLLTEICNLRQLTYLKLGFRNELGELPYTISNLEGLLTLDLRESWNIKQLPNVIWSMKQLRHILLSKYTYISKDSPDSSGKYELVEFSLPNLRTLYGLPGDYFKAYWLYKLTNLRALRVDEPIEGWSTSTPRSKDIIEVLSDGDPVSHKLEELWLYSRIHPTLETNSLNLSRYENLCNLLLEGIRMTELPQHDKLPPNLTILTLTETHIHKDPMETLKKLQKLKILRLMEWSYVGKELVCSGEHGDFPELEVLQIAYLGNLKKVVVEEGGMPRLKDCKIGNRARAGSTRMPETQLPDRLRNIIE